MSIPKFRVKAADICQSSRKGNYVAYLGYSKCPKISYTKVSDKMVYANNAAPDQTAPSGAVWSASTLFAILVF